MDSSIEAKVLERDISLIVVIFPESVSPRGEVLTKKFIKEFTKQGFVLTSELVKNVNLLTKNNNFKIKGLVVIEGRRSHEFLSFVSFFVDLNVDVFAVPGSPLTDFLIGEGAILATKPRDVLDIMA